MAKISKGHFHCVSCGLLFEARVISPANQFCPTCGDLVTGHKVSSSTPAPSSDVVSSFGEMMNQTEGSKRIIRKSKAKKTVFVVLLVWLLLMIATVWIVKFFSEKDVENDTSELARQKQSELQIKEDMRFVQDSIPACEQAILKFMKASSAGLKAQYVYRGRELISEIDKYYSQNPTFSSTRSVVKVASGNLLKNTKLPTIATFCVNADEESFEVNFIKSKGEWLIDWHAFVKHDSRSWVLYTSEETGEEGVFRLYMRVRDSNKDLNSDIINVVFYKPETYLKGEYRPIASSTVTIPIESELGEKILEMVERKDEVKDAYGKYISRIDPPGYHRVRVRLKLQKQGNEHSIELSEILASHWYGDEVVEFVEISEE